MRLYGLAVPCRTDILAMTTDKKRRRGRPSGGGRLPTKEVLEARAKGVPAIELAKRYGVTRQAIYDLVWKAKKNERSIPD